MCMKLERYKSIISVIESFHGRNYECEKLLQEKFPDIMPETLRSIYEIFYQKKMKRLHPRFHRSSRHLYQRLLCRGQLEFKYPDISSTAAVDIFSGVVVVSLEKLTCHLRCGLSELRYLSLECFNNQFKPKRYKAAVMNKEPLGILVRMSDEIELSAALMARLIVEEYYKESEEEYIFKVVDDSDNSGRRNPSCRGDDSIRSDDTAFGLSDDDNTENSNASASNVESAEAVQKDSQKQQAANSSMKSADGKLSPVRERDEVKVSGSACPRSSKKRNKKNRGKHKAVRSSTAEKSDTAVASPDPDLDPTAGFADASASDPTSVAADRDPADAGASDPTSAAADPDPADASTSVAADRDPADASTSVAADRDPDASADTADPDLAAAATEQEEQCTRIAVSDLINDTTLIKDKDLAYEVFLCHIEDDQYGPIIDCYRQSLGHHYEVRLLDWVKENNLVVQDEAALRKFGFDKTPDIKLDLPIAVNGAPIMWIESKAIFGDEETHQTYYNDQYIRYWNRFGPGLVIYWLGYLETIITKEERRILIRHELPADITKFSPDTIRSRKFSEKPFGAS